MKTETHLSCTTGDGSGCFRKEQRIVFSVFIYFKVFYNLIQFFESKPITRH